MSHPSSGSGIGNNYVIKTRGSRDDDTKDRKGKEKSQNSNRRNSIYGLQRIHTNFSTCASHPFYSARLILVATSYDDSADRLDVYTRFFRTSSTSSLSFRWNVGHFKRWEMILQVALMLRGLILFFLLTLSTWKTVQHHWKLDNSERNFCERRN